MRVNMSDAWDLRVVIDRSEGARRDEYVMFGKDKRTNEPVYLNDKLEWTPVSEGEVCGSFLWVNGRERENVAQSLMDALWRLGVRPTGEGSQEGVAAAKDAHIGDLRMVVTSLLAKGGRR